MESILLAITFIIGMFLPMQAGINGSLGKMIGNPVGAALISFAVGTLALSLYYVTTQKLAALEVLKIIPWWMWTGGLLGAVYVAVAAIVAHKIGASSLIMFTVAGQMLAALILDHYGLIGFPEHPINFWRLVGAGCLVVGVVLIRVY